MRPDLPYGAFNLFVVVAPHRSRKPLPVVDFRDRAQKLVETTFPGVFPDGPEYAGRELMRYQGPAEGTAVAKFAVVVYPTGLVELRWVIAVPPVTQLPLLDIVNTVRRVQQAVQSNTFWNLCKPRRLARRRVDWRIGVNGHAVPAGGGNGVYWTDVSSPGAVPRRRISDPRPSCLPSGYAEDRLKSVRRGAQLNIILVPVLEELLAAGGYLDGTEIRESVASVLCGADQLDAGSDGTNGQVTA